MWSGLIITFWVRHALHAIVPPVTSVVALKHLEVAALELRERDLLLDEFEEQFLLITNAPPQLSYIVFALL